ncbi:SMC family ATPase [Streptomyces sp. N2-109]|uniref:Nuclease SbcCD subunit C n=1 Tax=Streptomyces gossypii TaxID=2883101 RepID=A0ABT2K1E4_9ACTN|nr:SMC family ATPase [Streptomyces gossypii]MCT2593983.1 SMC family ATPase [Streptomyces gossypii]
MRPHRLTVTAFGPFGGTQHVDFDGLCADGLFLLHGATGAGKTSLLDAVCFALYGGVPGARQQPGGGLRSDHADAHTLTEVVLELSLGGRRLEITRRPEQLRPKKSGRGGLTRERAHAALREYNSGAGEWKALSRSHLEIGEEIGTLLGMSRDQFCQVALLPQGDFARFLRSGAEDRAKLLGRLFDTGRFVAVEDELVRMRRETQEEVRGADDALLALAHRMRQAAGTDLGSDLAAEWLPSPARQQAQPGGVPGQRATGGTRGAARGRTAGAEGKTETAAEEPAPAESVLEWAALARSAARERTDSAALAVRSAEEAHTRALVRLEDARELARRQKRYDAARQRAGQLRADAEERERITERLAAARAAEAVVPAVTLRATAAAEETEAARAESGLRAALPPEFAEAEPAALIAREHEARQELGTLASARRAEQRSDDLAAELAALESESRTDEEALREAEEWLAEWETARPVFQQRVEGAQDAATRAEHLAGQLGPARRRLAAARRRDRLETELQTAHAALLTARERSADAHQHWLDLRDRRLRGIAAELAAALRPGAACAVCGSPEHPAPAPLDDGHVDQSAEDAALEAYRRADGVREEAGAQLRALEGQLAAARTESDEQDEQDEQEEHGGPDVPGDGKGGDHHRSVGELAAAVAELEAGHAAAYTEASGAHEARESLARAEQEQLRRLAVRRDAERRLAARTSHREALQRERTALLEEVREASGDASGVAERATLLERTAGLLAAAAEAAGTARAAARRLADAGAGAADAARRARFETVDEALAAVLGEAEQGALRERLETWQAEERAVAAELADPGLAEAARLPAPDPAAAQTEVEAATRRLRDASAVQDAALHRCAELDRLSTRASADVRRAAPLRETHRRLSGLAGLAAGTSASNERKMRLETYVLAARLEQVAAAASARLARMSAGRYTLVHSAERASGRGRSGLGLHVIDSWTGVERDTASLSGGETFFASLALALGLADVVTDEAGGIPLDTLFIDEGFGSLDEETLDEVLDVLDSLRERDRSVGIVSHVADLRRRIPAQLEVVKTRTGSSLRHHAESAGAHRVSG